MKIAVAGTGYVGLSIAVLLAQHHQVTAVDIVPEKVDMINRRQSPIQDEYIEKYLAEKPLDLHATLNAQEAYAEAEFVVIATPTNYDDKQNYCNIWDAKSINGGTPKFSISLIIPKSDEATIRKIKAAIEAAYHDGESKLRGNGKTVPPLVAIKNPLRDGDTERPDDPAYKNAYFVNANSSTAPGVVDADCNPILTRSEVYSGVYGRASISFYAFNSNGNRGIACGLNNLQKIRDGEPLGGRASAESDFADDDEDFLS